MNALAQEHYAASFSGAPPGYAGSKESFTLFDKNTVEGDPYTPGIVLFDEVEKADPTVLRALLQVLDNGELRLANGQQKISFRNSYVFLTSNLALLRWQNVGDPTCGSSPIASGSIDRAMVIIWCNARWRSSSTPNSSTASTKP